MGVAGRSDSKKLDTNSRVKEISIFVNKYVGKVVAQWLRCCATNQKVAVSIPDGVIGIFH